ncbi:peptidase S26 family protein [Sphaerisporangium corydalis]|uniref:signal peptidase I n=1 Tax=Sphaerisporangium corydalis TaxID=1441875 RepID=A0ABV9EJJ9_9ACTN|nr:S26 family signal peptidase [Sphaerisporangium corydalis]
MTRRLPAAVLPAAGVALAAGLLLLSVRRSFLVATVDGPSMEPALSSGDRVLVRRTKEARTGQVLVFRFPDLPSAKGPVAMRDRQLLLKRVVAVPGDRLPVTWEFPDVRELAGEVVPPGSVVVLGDNRATSWDSRHYGFVPRERFVGIVIRRLYGSRASQAGSRGSHAGAGYEDPPRRQVGRLIAARPPGG